MFVGGFRCYLVVASSSSSNPSSLCWSNWVDRLGRGSLQTTRGISNRFCSHPYRTSSSVASHFGDRGSRDGLSRNNNGPLWQDSSSAVAAMLPSASSSSSTAVAPTNKPRTFYRRALPSHTCVALSSPQGRAYFESALRSNHLKSFFPLIEQFTTQSDPAYCGVSTLVMVLNALSVDPRKVWKAPWRWYEESMLNCCIDLEQVKASGITLPQFTCLASCQGLAVQRHNIVSTTSTTSYAATEDDNHQQSQASLEEFRKAVHLACLETKDEPEINEAVTQSEPLTILVVSYSRKVLGQTGDGHFSPVGAYDPVSDSVLILDTARFKYGAHWVKLPLLWEAMQPVDPATGRPRGYVLLSFPGDEDAEEQLNDSDQLRHAARPPQSLLFRSRMTDYQVRRQYQDFLKSLRQNNDTNETEVVTWEQVFSYWTKNGKDEKCIWQMLQPQLTPIDQTEREAVAEVRKVLNVAMKPFLVEANSVTPPDYQTNGSSCRSNLCRTMCLTPHEAIFLVYLASLESHRRREIVYHSVEQVAIAATDESSVSQTTAQDQLLSEAALIRLALDKINRWSTPTNSRCGTQDVFKAVEYCSPVGKTMGSETVRQRSLSPIKAKLQRKSLCKDFPGYSICTKQCSKAEMSYDL